jgi:hypothetical protein
MSGSVSNTSFPTVDEFINRVVERFSSMQPAAPADAAAAPAAPTAPAAPAAPAPLKTGHELAFKKLIDWLARRSPQKITIAVSALMEYVCDISSCITNPYSREMPPQMRHNINISAELKGDTPAKVTELSDPREPYPNLGDVFVDEDSGYVFGTEIKPDEGNIEVTGHCEFSVQIPPLVMSQLLEMAWQTEVETRAFWETVRPRE